MKDEGEGNLLVKGGVVPERQLRGLIQETDKLIAMFTASAKTAKRRKRDPRSKTSRNRR